MPEKPSYVSQCDVCSHPARSEIDSILVEKQEAGQKGKSIEELLPEIHHAISVGFPDSKLVAEHSIRNHYKRHKLIPRAIRASIDPESKVVHYGEEEIPIIPWELEVKLLRILAGRNILRQIGTLGVPDYKKLVDLEKQVKGDDTSLEQAAQEILAAGTPEGAKGPLKPPDGNSSKKSKKSNGS